MSQPGPPDRDPRWVSDSTFGIVRHVIVSGDLAAGLDDLNSDYREVALVLYRLHAQHWEAFYEQDDIGYPDAGGSTPHGWTEDLVWVFGRDRPGTEIELKYDDRVHHLQVDHSGWWSSPTPSRTSRNPTATPGTGCGSPGCRSSP